MAAIPPRPEYFELEEEAPYTEPVIDDSDMELLPEFPPVPLPVVQTSSPQQDAATQALLAEEKDLLADMGPVVPVLMPGSSVDPNSATSQALARRTRKNLSEKALAFRNRFLTEYLADFSPENAWIRAGGGGDPDKARAKGLKLLREGYVARKYREMIDVVEEKNLINRNRVIAGFIREANYFGFGASHSARVAALKGLSGILGMEQTTVNVKGKIDHMHKGGVMVVPVVPGSDAWEQLAEASQKKLKEDVRS